MRPHRSAAVLPLLWLAACGGDLGPTWVELGQGELQHDELADGDEVSIVRGPQGGTMVALSLEAGGVLAGDPVDPTYPDNPRVTFQSFALDDAERSQPYASITVVRGLQEAGDGALELFGTWLVFDAALDEALDFDQALAVNVRIVDALGNEATDTAEATALGPGDDDSTRGSEP